MLAGLGGCGGDDDQGQPPAGGQQTETQAGGADAGRAPAMPSAQELSKMAEQNRQALAEMNQGKVVEAVTGDSLKALLPADLAGMQRTDASAERTQAMGVDISRAEGQYTAAEGDGSVTVAITDAGSMSGPMRMGLAGWAMAQYSRETDEGYEKTTTYDGHKAMEEYNKQDRYGAVRVFIAERFIVEVEGNGVTMETLKQALGKVDLKKLAGLGSGS